MFRLGIGNVYSLIVRIMCFELVFDFGDFEYYG